MICEGLPAQARWSSQVEAGESHRAHASPPPKLTRLDLGGFLLAWAFVAALIALLLALARLVA